MGNQKYSKELKTQAVEEYLSGGRMMDVVRKYEISSERVQQDFRVSSLPKWLTDITCIPCKDGMLYLSCMKDLRDKPIDLTQVVIAVITLIIGCISAFLIPYLKSKLTAEQISKVKFWVNIAVEAAEMIYVGTGRGAEKKEYVLSFLNSKGFTLNMTEIDNLIEAAVLELKTKAKEEASV